jgi:hypothetical protein
LLLRIDIVLFILTGFLSSNFVGTPKSPSVEVISAPLFVFMGRSLFLEVLRECQYASFKLFAHKQFLSRGIFSKLIYMCCQMQQNHVSLTFLCEELIRLPCRIMD